MTGKDLFMVPRELTPLILALFSLYLLFLGAGVTSSGRSSSELSRLAQEFKSGGIEAFLKQKELFRAELLLTIRSVAPASDQFREASGIATYLFPELLETESFERHIAEKEWLPLENEIEKEPGSVKSRALFEELRADIANYEYTRTLDTDLSTSAGEVIGVYDLLSTQ